MSFCRNYPFVPTILGLALVWPRLLQAENISYPAGAPGVIVVTNAPYNAVPDGVTDCTAALQSAFNNNNKLVYLPNGTYRVTAPLIATNSSYPFGLVIQGQSQTGAVIRLANSSASFASGFTNPVIWMGQDPPQRFGNSIRNLTIDTGSGNPGAIALRYYANNFGCARDLTLKSSDGQGIAGLDMSYSRANGPNLIKNLMVDGFQKGIWTGYAMESLTFENITLTNQTVLGWLNENDRRVVNGLSHTNAGQVLSIRNLNARSLTVTAFKNPSGHVVLLDSTLIGTGAASSAVAITNGATGRMYVRNLTTSGYSKPIGDGSGAFIPPGSSISEWTSDTPVTLASTANTRLALPIQETPDVPWDDPSTWANIKNFGATDWNSGEGTQYDDDAPAVQAAIDSGATTVFVPGGNYRVLSPILVRGNVRRIIGVGQGSVIGGGNNSAGIPYSGIVWQVVDGSNSVVVIEDMGAGSAQDCVGVDNQSSRTLVLRDLSLQPPRFTRGSGDLFIENVVARHWEFNPRRVWARQINPEGDGTHLANRGATLWVMGLKTEDWGPILDASGFARTEILGGMIYSLDDARPTPMLRSVNSRLNFSLNEYLGRYGNAYTNLVLEVRNGITNNLFRGSPSPTYPANWSQKNDGTTADSSGTVGSDITWFTGWNYPVAPVIVTNPFSVTTGNADAFMDPGETVAQNVVLWNSGSLPFTSVTATLATTNPGVTLVTSNAAYPDFAAGDQQTNATAFAYRLSKSLTPGAPLTFTLVTTGLTNGSSVSFTNTFAQTVGQTIVNAVTNLVFSANVPVAIGPLSTNYCTNAVAGIASPILGVQVGVRADHNYLGNLAVSLQHPDGTEVWLINQRGGSGKNFGGTSGSTTNFTLLSDDASVDIYAGGSNGGLLFAGTNGYRPESPLSALYGKSANGNWRLRIANVGSSNGTLIATYVRLVTGTNSYTASLYNTAPVASNLTVTVSSLSTNLALSGSDADGDPLTFQTNSLPANGVLSGFNTNTGAFTYTPNSGYGGPDSFTFRANDGYSNSVPATVSLTVISPTSLGVTSPTNPAGYLASLTFTATVSPAAATGSVQFKTNGFAFGAPKPLISGVAVSEPTASLPRGTNTITVEYAGSTYYLGTTNSLPVGQVVTNHPPVATNDVIGRVSGLPLTIPIASLLANDTDADSDSLVLVGVSITTNGMSLSTDATNVYVPANTVADRFTYTIQDGYGGTNLALVMIPITATSIGQGTTVSLSGGSATVNFAGVEGLPYEIQRATNVTFTGTLRLWPTNAPVGGLFSVTDDFSDLGSVPPTAYYRLRYAP